MSQVATFANLRHGEGTPPHTPENSMTNLCCLGVKVEQVLAAACTPTFAMAKVGEGWGWPAEKAVRSTPPPADLRNKIAATPRTWPKTETSNEETSQ